MYRSNPALSGTKELVHKESEYKQKFKPWKYTPVSDKRDKKTEASPAKKQKVLLKIICVFSEIVHMILLFENCV